MATDETSQGLTRRSFLAGTAAAATAAAAVLTTARESVAAETAAAAPTAAADKDFTFLLLGDLHYDQMDHHDHEWLKREQPNDVRQVENYSRITREVLPGLFRELKEQAKAEKATFTCHIGDLVEGLAGTPELAKRQNTDMLAFVEGSGPSIPFLFCKGNHDVTGPGAVEAFDSVLLPFLARQAGQKLTGQNFSERRGDCLFAYFDSYHTPDASLDWLEKTLAARGDARQVFVVIHPPVVPYGARSNWHLFARPSEAAKRERLLNLLGEHHAIVLCGHLHKYGTVVRETPKGRFLQVAVISVIPQADVKAKDEEAGVEKYGPDLVQLEASFSPNSLEERKKLLEAEKPFIKHWEYADAPGYGVVRVQNGRASLDLYLGLGRRKWRTVPLSDLLEKTA